MAGVKQGEVWMRKADSTQDEFHLLEEVSKPFASLNAAQIALWVYRGKIGEVRELVLAGHAESLTCSRATSALMEAVKKLDESTEWMLTCGAAFVRAKRPAGGARSEGDPGPILAETIAAMSELAEETGLVRIVERGWDELREFRRRYREHATGKGPRLVLPVADRVPLADYLPIIPARSTGGQPLVFHLEGWDFDCPAFQAVADLHLRRVRREMLRDALRRRTQYRSWLKEWVERWVRDLKSLRKSNADKVFMLTPGPIDESEPAPERAPEPVPVGAFLEERLQEFLDRSQDWHGLVAHLYGAWPFAGSESPDLDAPYTPDTVKVIDFETGDYRERPGQPGDETTHRERIMRHDPMMISECLRYIRRMDAIIAPYEDLRLWQRQSLEQARRGNASRKQREAACVAEVSRRIVVETMIRGWPSFYLEDEEDQAVFDAWADEYRSHVWSIMNRQARAAGVAVDVLLEDNVVYDVRFDDDLGCAVQPLMLVDTVSHAQVHGGRAGASACVPMWPRRCVQAMPSEVMAVGATNCARAEAMVEKAKRLTTGPNADVPAAAACLRLALGCHPGKAGRRILEEWSRRLGRDTQAEFSRASEVVDAQQLWRRDRFEEAATRLQAHLAAEPRPARYVLALAALAEVVLQQGGEGARRLGGALADRREKVERYEALRENVSENLGAPPETLTRGELEAHVRTRPDAIRKLNDLGSLVEQIEKLDRKLEGLERQRADLVGKALSRPGSVRAQFPTLARAAEEAKAQLATALEDGHRALFPSMDEEMACRYGDAMNVVEMRTVFELLHRLGSTRRQVEVADRETRRRAMQDLKRLASDPWMPEGAVRDLRELVERFGSADWDLLLARQIGFAIEGAMWTCRIRIKDLLSELMRHTVPLAEPLTARIHITQTIDGKYQEALQMVFGATVALGRAIRQPWRVLETGLCDMPDDGAFEFVPREGVVVLNTEGRSVPLLQASGLEPEEADYLARIVADPGLPERVNRFASCLAEGLLAVEVEPRPCWLLWRDAMERAGRELLLTVALFSYEASPLPAFAPPMARRAKEAESRLDHQKPRDIPELDLDWADLGRWGELAGPNSVRTR